MLTLHPVNYNKETNSQEIGAVQKVTWSITGWKRYVYMRTYEQDKCGTYLGKVGFH